MKKLALLATTSVLALGVASFNGVSASSLDDDNSSLPGDFTFTAPSTSVDTDELLERYEVLVGDKNQEIKDLELRLSKATEANDSANQARDKAEEELVLGKEQVVRFQQSREELVVLPKQLLTQRDNLSKRLEELTARVAKLTEENKAKDQLIQQTAPQVKKLTTETKAALAKIKHMVKISTNLQTLQGKVAALEFSNQSTANVAPVTSNDPFENLLMQVNNVSNGNTSKSKSTKVKKTNGKGKLGL